MKSYQEFLESKRIQAAPVGFEVERGVINPMLFPFQRDIARWALKRGRAAIWADCGLGKGPMQLEWSRHVCRHTSGDVLLLAPLAVSRQFEREAEKFGIRVAVCKSQADVRPGINITNYERLHLFRPEHFVGVSLDESSILKAYDGKLRTEIIEMFSRTPYRLANSATPAPNDYMELGNHAEFLGIMSRVEMLSMFFVHDGGDTSKWRLKGHAEEEFWKWLASWAVMLRKPSDLGYEDDGFVLPPLEMHSHVVESRPQPGTLFALEAQTLLERRAARRESLEERCRLAAALANASVEPWLIWVDLNAEGDLVTSLVPDAVQVAGSDSDEHKERAMIDFAAGRIRVLVSKPTIAGYGMNWQHCPNMAFVGLSDSFEQFYQATRRCWRFGQENTVRVHVITSQAEGAVVANIERKEADAKRMAEEMVKHMRAINEENIRGTTRERDEYRRAVESGNGWTMHLGDCVEVVGELASESIDYSVFSPPFGHSLYTYSNSERDMGNGRAYRDFARHYSYLVRELYRVLKPGRLVSVHCMLLPMMKYRDGDIGLFDFRGSLIRIMQRAGFIFHSEVTIWKDPVTAMQRTKALGLLYKQLKKDSTMSRQGVPDYLVTMRKPGANPDPVTKDPDEFPVSLWQNYASPVWMDINPSDTLQRESAREEKDERHIAPLQLEVIRRAIRLWTNPGDLVLSPFAGIGSEGVVALELSRRFVGVELKESYWKQAVANLQIAEMAQTDLFDYAGLAV